MYKGYKTLRKVKRLVHLTSSFFFSCGNLVARIHLIRWISGVSGVRTPTPAYNNVLSYQLNYVHGTHLTSS